MPTISTKHWRGTYVARLLEGKRGVEREWVNDPKIEKLTTGGSRRLYTVTEPGWYEVREGYRTYQGRPNPPTVYRVTRTSVEPVTEPFDVLTALQGPNPGEPGELWSDRCECGEPVHRYDRDGWPTCQKHDTTLTPEWVRNGMETPA